MEILRDSWGAVLRLKSLELNTMGGGRSYNKDTIVEYVEEWISGTNGTDKKPVSVSSTSH